VNLNAWVAALRRRILDDLVAGRPPSEGAFDEEILKEGRAKGRPPQMGAVTFEPGLVRMEFIFSDALSSATVLTVTAVPPERIVFLPVPEWVIETIWQGEVSGSHHFESDARRLVETFAAELESEANERWFGPQPARRRE
jgi:hypothetical protein